jgi:CBS domain containing-hemolysin-like protein
METFTIDTNWLIITIISLILSGFFSGVEIAFVTSERVRVGIDATRGGIINRIINKFYSDSDFFISTILVGNNIMLVVYGMGAALLLEPWLQHMFGGNQLVMLIAQTLISTAVVLFAGEFFPKTISRINPNNSLRILALPIYLFYIILYPISLFSTWLSRTLIHLTGLNIENPRLGLISVTDLNDYLEETIDTMEEKEEEVETEVKIFQNALDFSSCHLRDCMLPRNEMIAVNINATTRDELSELFTSSGRSKIIVYDEDIDTIKGYIHVSELFDPEVNWKERIKPVIFAPEAMLANKMMRRLLSEKRSIAIVVDEFGGTAGMVTLEDLVEEIFGDIQDEHDKTRLTSKKIAPGVYELSGRLEIEEINELYDLDIPESDEYQTLAGYILTQTGSIPSEGETVMLNGLQYDIIKKSATRLELIKVTKKITETEK